MAVRKRWLIIALWAAAWFVPEFLRTFGQPGEWLFFEAGAFSIDDATPLLSSGLHVYVHDPALQIGPPSLFLLAAALTMMSAHAAEALFAVFMAVTGPGVLWILERVSVSAKGGLQHRTKGLALVGGLIVSADWSFQSALWRHLDDCLATVFVVVALVLLIRQRAWPLVAVGLGVAAAAQPWAIGAAPLILALPRRRWPLAAALLLATAAAWWAPFVLTDIRTVTSLGGYHAAPSRGSVLYLLGMRGNVAGWLRPTQLSAEVVSAAFVVRRGGVARVFMAVVCTRLLLDPYVWSYYAVPLLAAALTVDLIENRWTWPRWTLGAVAVEVLAPFFLPAEAAAALRLIAGVWAVALCLSLTAKHHPSAVLKVPSPRPDDLVVIEP